MISLLAVLLVLPALSAFPAGAVPSKTPASTWHTNGVVWAVERVGDKLILGGEFTKLVAADGRTVDRVNLAALDVNTGEPLAWRADANGPVLALAAKGDGSVVYVGGDFQRVKGVDRTRLAAVRTSDAGLTALSHKAAGRVRALHVRSGRLYVAGEFDALGGLSRARVGAIDIASGAVVTSFAPMVQGGSVRDIDTSPDSNRLYLAGTFTSVAASPGTAYGAAVRTADGSAVAWNAGLNQPLFDVLATGDRVYLAVGGVGWDNNRLQQHSASTGNEQSRYVADGDIQELELRGNVLYIGGHFVQLFGGVPRYQLAAIDIRDGEVLGFNPNIETKYGVWDMAAGPEGLWIGGEFTRVGGVVRRGLAKLPGNPAGIGEDQALVQRSHTWKFFDLARSPGAGWTTQGFNDAGWSSARGELGYGPVLVNRTTARVNTLYARRTFQVSDPASFSALEIRHLADDGAAIYLNGVEVVRDNLPDGTLSYGTKANSSRFSEIDTYSYRKSTVAANRLRAGDNVIAVEIHNVSSDSNDLRFGLELLGRRVDAPANPVINSPATCTTSVAGQNVTVSWASVGAAASYVVYRNPDNTSDYKAGETAAPTRSLVDRGVRTDASFTYKVIAVAADGSRSAKKTCSPNVRTTAGGTIAAPASCSVAVDGASVRVSWPAVGGADKYYAYRGINGGTAVWAGKADAPATAIVDGNVSTGRTYSYSVVSVDPRGTKSVRRACNPASVSLGATPPPATISAPATCSTSLSGSTVTVSYAAVNGAARYTVFRNPDGAADYWAGTGTGTSVIDADVRSGPTFTYKVIAIDAAGNRSSKRTCSPTVTISPNPPPPPVAIAAPASCSTTVSGDDITVNWTGVAGADKYYVYRSVNGAADAWAAKAIPPATSFVDANRAPGSYIHRVVAVDPRGRKSAKTTCAPGRTIVVDPSPAQPSRPASCSISAQGTNVAVSWTSSQNHTGYQIFRYMNGGSEKLVSTRGSGETSYTHVNAPKDVSLTYAIQAVGNGGTTSAKRACTGKAVIDSDPCAGLRVELFDGADYVGSLGRFGVGAHALPNVNHDRATSLKVPLGLRLEVYDFVDFTGYLGAATSNVSQLFGANNDIEAIRVVCEL